MRRAARRELLADHVRGRVAPHAGPHVLGERDAALARCALAELLRDDGGTARPPREAPLRDVGTLLLLQRSAAPVPPRRIRPETPVELERVILTLIEKDPARRIPSCRELAAHLLDIEASLQAPAA